MQTQPKRVVRTIVSNSAKRGELRNNVIEWRNQAGAEAAAILNAENNMAPEMVPPAVQKAIVVVLVLVAVALTFARKLGLV